MSINPRWRKVMRDVLGNKTRTILVVLSIAVGVAGVFMETHVNPAEALSDKENAIAFAKLRGLWKTLQALHAVVA